MGRNSVTESYAGYIYASDPRYRDSVPESTKPDEIKLGQPSAEYLFFDNAFELLDLCNEGKTKMRDIFRFLVNRSDDAGTIDFRLVLDFFSPEETTFTYTRVVRRVFELLTEQLPTRQIEMYNISEFAQLGKNVIKESRAVRRALAGTNAIQRRGDGHAHAMTVWNKESGKLKAACRAECEKMCKEDDNESNDKKKSIIPHISIVTGFILFLAIMFFGFVYKNRRERKAGNSTKTEF